MDYFRTCKKVEEFFRLGTSSIFQTYWVSRRTLLTIGTFTFSDSLLHKSDLKAVFSNKDWIDWQLETSHKSSRPEQRTPLLR